MTNRVATLTLNPAIDMTAGVRGFQPGSVNRIQWEQEDAAGKGVNVASYLADFGVAMTVSGFLGRDNDQAFRALFAAKGIDNRFVPVAGRTRTNIKLVDEAAGADGITDINFPGFTVGASDVVELESVVDRLAADHEWFVLAGSLPGGVSNQIFGQLAARLRRHGRKAVVDTSGAALASALDGVPLAVKPNDHELGELLGRPIDDAAAAAAGAAELHARGVATVIVSMGAAGAVFSDGRQALLAVPPAVTVRSTVGAGDAMVAGFVLGNLRGLDLAGQARLATAFSVGAVSTFGPRLPPVAETEAFAKQVKIEFLGG
jgi:1-phosphofructokinase